MNGFLINNFRN